jgi:hypothetical protein
MTMKPVRERALKMAWILAVAMAGLILPGSWAVAGRGGSGGHGHSGGNESQSNRNVRIYSTYGWYWNGGYSAPYGVYAVNGGYAPVVPSVPIIEFSGVWGENGGPLFWVP